MNKTRNIIITIVSILIVAGLGSIFVNIGMNWFNALDKPSMWIPNIIIPIVWSIIYLAFGIILIRWQSNENLSKRIAALLFVNGILNILWCLFFFALKQTFIGEIIIIINLIAGWILINEINKEKNIYALILLIYPIWLSVATSLNTAMWILN